MLLVPRLFISRLSICIADTDSNQRLYKRTAFIFDVSYGKERILRTRIPYLFKTRDCIVYFLSGQSTIFIQTDEISSTPEPKYSLYQIAP